MLHRRVMQKMNHRQCHLSLVDIAAQRFADGGWIAQDVQQIVLKNGHGFPGIQKEKNGDLLEIYDLSKTPAVLLTIKSSDVMSMKAGPKWTHPPTSAGYTQTELADIIAYLKFVSTGVAKEVTVADLH